MCKVDFECELEEDNKGTKIYPSVESLKKDRKCVEQCGIVKVKVELVEVVQGCDYSSLK
jgi:hypothetical protein